MFTRFVQPCDRLDYIPDRDISAGEIVFVGDLVGVARLDIPKDTLGTLWLVGIYDLVKGEGVSVAFTFGKPVYWNPTIMKAAAETGEGFTRIGVCTSQHDEATSALLRFRLNG